MCRLIVKSRGCAVHHQKPILQKTNLLEEEAVLKCRGRKRILQLCRALFVEKGAMP
jgi:hypothetical protein